MKLEDKFHSVFFYPFLVGISLSIFIVIFIITYYSQGFLDERTAKAVYDTEKKFARDNIYSANIILTNFFLKIQLILEEQLSLFDLASKMLNASSNYNEPKEVKDVHSIFEDPKVLLYKKD